MEEDAVMKCSGRQWQILDLLLSYPNDITAGELAENIGVSSRTIHRELLEIEQLILPYNVKLHKKSGIGIQLSGDEEALKLLKEQLLQSETHEYSPQDRRILTICWLLESDEPIKLFSLAHDLHVAIPTISSDLDEIEGWVNKKKLTLLRRRGYGVQIKGTESTKRKAISSLAEAHLDDSELFTSSPELPVNPVSKQLLSMVGKANFFEVERALWQLEESYPTSLNESQYTQLLIKLSVSITRMQQGKTMDSDDVVRLSAPEGAGEKVKLFVTFMKCQMPPTEIRYFSHLFQIWDPPAASGLISQDDFQLADRVAKMIRFVEKELNVPFSKDISLREDLLNHLEPAIERIREGNTIRNPLLIQIKRDYESLFEAIQKAVSNIIHDCTLPEEEIAFIAMHFGASLERSTQFKEPIKALIVCTSGIGSSKMLAVRIMKEFPHIELAGHVSWFQASRVPKDDYNLIISTVDLPLPTEQYIKISPLLTADETLRLNHFIQNQNQRNKVSKGSSGFDSSTLHRMKSVKDYLDEAYRLIEHFEIIQLESPDQPYHLRELLLEIGLIIRQKGWIEQVEPIVKQLIERENQSSQLIPDTNLALFHTRSEFVRQPFILLCRLDQPITLGQPDKAVKHILFMLGPRQLTKQSIEILSEISAMLLNNEVIQTLTSGNQDQIQLLIAKELEHFIKSKMEW
jgi:mannitol operon transcriptional antiterminator